MLSALLLYTLGYITTQRYIGSFLRYKMRKQCVADYLSVYAACTKPAAASGVGASEVIVYRLRTRYSILTLGVVG